jgi:hypothetical protein
LFPISSSVIIPLPRVTVAAQRRGIAAVGIIEAAAVTTGHMYKNERRKRKSECDKQREGKKREREREIEMERKMPASAAAL